MDAPACRGGRRKGREEGIKGGEEEVDGPEARKEEPVKSVPKGLRRTCYLM